MNDAIPGVGKLDKNVLQHCLAGEGRRRGESEKRRSGEEEWEQENAGGAELRWLRAQGGASLTRGASLIETARAHAGRRLCAQCAALVAAATAG